MAQDVELVVENRRARDLLFRAPGKGPPHVHHRQSHAAALADSQPLVKLIHALLRAISSSEPDRATADQIADDDPIAVAFADGQLVDADDRRSGVAGASDLLLHVLLLQILNRLPIEV
jgi:hypothetical protein